MSQTKEVTSDAPFRNCSKNVSSHAITLGIGCLENLHHARNASEYAAPAPIELALQWWAAPNREIRVGEAGIPQSNDDDRHESRHCEAQATMPSPPQFTPPQFVEPDVQDTRDQFEAGVLPSVLASARVRGEGFDKGFGPREPSGLKSKRRDGAKHSTRLLSRPSGALGSPSIIRGKMRSPRPSALKVRISSSTHREAAAWGEQMTISEPEDCSAARISRDRSAALASSLRSRNTGTSRRGMTQIPSPPANYRPWNAIALQLRMQPLPPCGIALAIANEGPIPLIRVGCRRHIFRRHLFVRDN